MNERDLDEHSVGFDEYCEDCEDDPIGCVFPGKCVMPGTHLESECATAEMMEELTAPAMTPARLRRDAKDTQEHGGAE